MKAKRIFILARRIVRQVLRDRRTVGLLVVGPMLVLTLGAILFRAEPAPIPLGIVNEDDGLTLPVIGAVNLGDRVVTSLQESEHFQVISLAAADVPARLRDGRVQAVLLLDASFSTTFQQTRQAHLALQLEGSNPARSRMITGLITEAAMRALAGLASAGFNPAAESSAAGAPALPVLVDSQYLFAGEQFDTMDFVAPVYIAALGMFFVFLLTCVSFLRERTQGTMERLMATPTTRFEVVMGYLLGLGFFALAQMSVILFFTIWVLKIHYLGSLVLMFIIVALLAIVGVSLGILASAFARNEFQVVQFIPLLILPQVLLGGTLWAVEDMPGYLRPLTYLMPLTYANWALRDVMLKGFGLSDIWSNLVALTLFGVLLVAAGALTMRREIA